MYLSDQFVHIYLLFSKSQKISSDGFSKGQVNMNVVVSIEVLNTKSIVFQLLNGNIWCCASDDCLIVRWNPCEWDTISVFCYLDNLVTSRIDSNWRKNKYFISVIQHQQEEGC